MADDLAAEIAAHRLCDCGLPHQFDGCAACAGRWPCLVRRLADREAEVRAAARIAVDGLTAADICHGPEFDSESWGNDCDVCRVMRPLVRTLAPADGEPAR